MADRAGQPLCDVLPAVHALAGCDITSKFGTKAAALKANPVSYLRGFGRTAAGNDEECLAITERYLVQGRHPGTHDIVTMDHLRCTLYHHRQSAIVLNLPPTSYATTARILRAFYAIDRLGFRLLRSLRVRI